ncbi:MAG: hypothetical protein GYB64_18865 [Chloroflexi bacterium]|nr:hypothetical protein [Chloroflexota bacterium]
MNDIRIDRNTARYILLGLGVVALIVFAIAFIVTPGNRFTTTSYVALGVVVLALAGFIALDPEALVESVTGRAGQYTLTSILLSAVAIAAVIGLNVLISQANFAPVDATEGSRYRLSESSQELLDRLEEPVEAIAFYGESPAAREEADLWLRAYEREAEGNFTFRFVDPDREPLLAQQFGVTGTNVIVLTQGDRTAEATGASERSISNALLQVLIGEERKAYAVTGHGERDISGFEGEAYSEIVNELGRFGFEVETLNLLQLEDGAIPDDADMLIIAGPEAQFAPREIEILDAYLTGGGALMVFAEAGLVSGGALGSGVLGVDFAPSGDFFVTAGSDGTARVWDAGSRDEIAILRGHGGAVVDVSVSSTGDIATLSLDGTVRIWDTEGEELTVLEGHQSDVGGIDYSPDGALLASAAGDQIIRVWNTDTYEEASFSPIAVPAQMFDVAFSPDSESIAVVAGRQSATGSVEGLLYLWDAASGEQIDNARVHGDVAFSLAYTPDGSEILTVAVDGTQGTYDVSSGEATTTTLFEETGITSIAVTEEGQAIYALFDATIRVGEDVSFERHENTVWDASLGPDDDTLVSVSADGNIRLWSLEAEEQIGLIEAPHTSVDVLREYLIEEMGVQLNNDLVIDVTSEGLVGDVATPVLNNFGNSPIVETLDDGGTRPVMFTAQSMLLDAPSENVVQVSLIETAGTGNTGQPLSWGETSDPTVSGGGVEFNPGEDIPGPVTVAVSVENIEENYRAVIFGDADFASNTFLQNRANFNNAELVINAANWLTEGENALDIPTDDFGQNTIEEPLPPIGVNVLSIAMTCLLPGVMLLVGAGVWFARRRRR